jgi:hypothetical protein
MPGLKNCKENEMDMKTWKQRLEEGETIQEIIFSEPVMGINSWLEKCNAEGLSDEEENEILRYADAFNRISFQIVSPAAFARQWRKTVNV